MLGVLGALMQEVEGLREGLHLRELARPLSGRLFTGDCSGEEIIVAQTGMGRARAEAVTRLLLDRYPLTALICVGFGGALSPCLKAGDIVLCHQLRCLTHAPDPPLLADARLLQATDSARGGMKGQAQIVVGGGITADRLITEPKEKKALGESFASIVVDMESYWVARLAKDKGLPFFAIRAISDEMTFPLPALAQFYDAERGWDLGKSILHFLAYPNEAILLPYVYRHVRRAQESLAHFLLAALPHLTSKAMSGGTA